MYSYIKGQITRVLSDRVTLEQGGIGYEIFCDANTLRQASPNGDEIKIWTYLYLRENVMQLYGFTDLEQRTLFELLLSVSGIGPKVALSIISSLSADRFILAVLDNDIKCLTSIKHVGKKSAERMVVDLRDKLKSAKITSVTPSNAPSVALESDLGNGVVDESLAALMVLGYGRSEAECAINRAISDTKAAEQELRLESIIKLALRNLAG